MATYALQLENDPNSPFYGDIALVNNNWVFTQPGPDTTRQNLQCNYRAFRGEWFLDTSSGVPWIQEVLKKNPSFPAMLSILKTVGLDTDGVLSITKFEFDLDGSARRFRLDAGFRVDDGSGGETTVDDFIQLIEV